MKKVLLLLTTSLILLVGCNDDDSKQQQTETQLKQGWKLTSQTINGSETDLSEISLEELMYFTDQSLCYLATPTNKTGNWEYLDLRTAWSYDSSTKILNIAARLPVCYYIDILEATRLSLHYYIYNEAGNVDLYQNTYQSASVEIKDLKVRLSRQNRE